VHISRQGMNSPYYNMFKLAQIFKHKSLVFDDEYPSWKSSLCWGLLTLFDVFIMLFQLWYPTIIFWESGKEFSLS